MKQLKKLETILHENKWSYDPHEGRDCYNFPDLNFSVEFKFLHERVGKSIPDIHCEGWPDKFFEQGLQEETQYTIKLKDFHLVTMMLDYKFTSDNLTLIFKDQEWTFPLSFLPNFGNKIKVRKNKKDELECIGTQVIIPALLIEESISSATELVDLVLSFFSPV